MKQQGDKLVCVGKIVAAHGIKGDVKIHSYTADPEDLLSYGDVFNADASRLFDIKIRSIKKEMIIASIDGIASRNDAECLKGQELFVKRDQLPQLEDDEFYIEDLQGLRVNRAADGTPFGVVHAVHNFGAGDIVEIKQDHDGKTVSYSFIKVIFPQIDLKAGVVTIAIPEDI